MLRAIKVPKRRAASDCTPETTPPTAPLVIAEALFLMEALRESRASGLMSWLAKALWMAWSAELIWAAIAGACSTRPLTTTTRRPPRR